MPTLDNYSLGNYGLSGPILRYASGLVTSGSTGALEPFKLADGTTTNKVVISVTGLGFVPDVILLRVNTSLDTFANGIIVDTKTPKQSGYTIFVSRNDLYRLDAPAYVNESGFKLPTFYGGTVFEWQAFKTQ